MTWRAIYAWRYILVELDIRQPPGGVARSEAEALVEANKIGYPVMVRPSFVLGGRGLHSSTFQLKHSHF